MEAQFTLQIKEDQFTRLANYIRDLSGIDLKPHKLSLVQNRLGKYVKNKGFFSIDEYISNLIKNGTKQDRNDLLDLITTNFTSFFREKEHFDFISGKIKSSVNEGEMEGPIRIWSAACSSGEEPYSIAMELCELNSMLPIDFKILASDVSPQILAQAKLGIYGSKKMNGINPFLISRYFDKQGSLNNSEFHVKEKIKKKIHFTRINLLMDSIPFKSKFNFIFCRNVMIYFNKETQEKIVSNLYKYMEDGGYLFLGHSESLTGLNQPFNYLQPSIYYKG